MRFIIAFLAIHISAAIGQPVFFEKIFGTAASDQCRGMVQTANGTIFVAGYSDLGIISGFDVTLSKLKKDGTLQWIKYYGDSLNNHCLYINTTTDGNLVLCGETNTTNNLLDGFLFKIDTSGNLIWEKYYGGAFNESLKYVEQTMDGGYILAGFHNDSFASNNSYVIKTDVNGNAIWAKSIGGTNNDYADAVSQMPDGSYIVTADTKSFGAGEYDVELIKLSAAGNIIWDYTYGDSLNNGCQGLHLTTDGNLISYGETEIFQFSPFDFYMEKIDPNGNSLWKKVFGGSGSDAAFSVTELNDGKFILTGYSNSYNNGPINLIVLKTDSAGNLIWTQNYGSPSIDIGYKVIQSVDGGLLIAGTATDSINFDSQYYLLHLDQAGLLTSYNNPTSINKKMIIYPNPSSGNFYINNTTAGDVIKIYSQFGSLVFSSVSNQYSTAINTNLSAGIYTITVYGKNSISNNRLIISH